jgi:hypothetical protein
MAAVGKVRAFIKQSVPDVLLNLSQDQKQELGDMLGALKGLSSELTTTASEQVESVQGSNFNHPAIYTPAAGAWVATMGAALKTLEGTCSKSVDEVCYFQVAVIGSFLVLTVALVVVIYVRKKRFETTQIRTTNRDLLKAMESKVVFFKKARSLAEHVIEPGAANPSELLNRLKPYFVGSKARSVPPDLASEFGIAFYLANKPEKLRTQVNTKILPLIKHYVEDLQPKIQTLQAAIGVGQRVLEPQQAIIEVPDDA